MLIELSNVRTSDVIPHTHARQPAKKFSGDFMDLFDESYERHKQSVSNQEARWNNWLASHPLVLVVVASITILIILLAMHFS